MKNGATVKRFEEEFAAYVGGRFAIALNSGTSTLHTAIVALGIGPGDSVAVPPLTMSATTIAVLHAGATPLFRDVDERTWLVRESPNYRAGERELAQARINVSLYGLHYPSLGPTDDHCIDDAAQTLRPHGGSAFTSYSFQASKILALGEGGMLVTDDEKLATRAREFSSLGYRMRADQPRIDPAALKSPTFDRHYSLGWNYRMADLVAAEGLKRLAIADELLSERAHAASLYRNAVERCSIAGCPPWLTQQHVPDGFTHNYWTYAVACDSPDRALRLADAVVKHGGERPYPAWRLTYDEPAFRYLVCSLAEERGLALDKTPRNLCPVAESLQPRLLQFQTNDLASAERNAGALRKAIEELSQ